MENITYKYKHLLGKSFYRNNWLSLEIISVFAVICLLILAMAKEIPSYLYKTIFVEMTNKYLVDARVKQQEYYAWHGQLLEDNTLNRDNLYSVASDNDASDGVSHFVNQGNQLKVSMNAYHEIEAYLYKFELQINSAATILINCEDNAHIPIKHQPYICKMRNHDN